MGLAQFGMLAMVRARRPRADEALNGDAPRGQQRAINAIRFGVEMRLPSHDLFVIGPPGTGWRSFV